jgi:hypothetical protein
MPLRLNCYGRTQQPYIDGDGDLIYRCPFCKKMTFIRSDDFSLEGEELRTRGTMKCGAGGCNVLFDISHSNIVLWEPTRPSEFIHYPRCGDHETMRGVWKTRNNRRRR